MKTFRKMILVAAALMAFAPSHLFACAACGSANSSAGSSPLANGMNGGILTLLGVLLLVLASAATFFIFIIRREAAAQSKKSPIREIGSAPENLPAQNPSAA